MNLRSMATYLIRVLVSPNSLFSTTCLYWMTACCFEAEGWEMGMSATCL